MYTIVVKISDPHKCAVAQEFLNHNKSYLGIKYMQHDYATPSSAFEYYVSSEKFTPKILSEGIYHWLSYIIFKDKANVLILTENTEEENQELIQTMRELNIGKEGFPTENICIVICKA